MASIIRGTTPSIRFTFDTVEVSDIVTAIMTIKYGNCNMLEKTMTDAEIGDGTITWTLSQSETLAFGTGQVSAMLNFVTQDGTRGASEKYMLMVVDNHIDEVI